MRNIYSGFFLVCILVPPWLCEEVSREENPCKLNLRVLKTSPVSATFRWSNPCGEADYKVQYEHLEWISCPTGSRSHKEGSGRGYISTTDVEFAISGLLPYSRYRITVKALPKDPLLQVQEEFLIAETQPSPPQTRPTLSVIDTKTSIRSLKFFWRDPLTSECESFNGRLNGTRYVFRGEELWNIHDERLGIFPEDQTSFEFEELQPYSRYSLRLYARNDAGFFGVDPLVLSSKTLSDSPRSPMHLEVLSASKDGVVSLRWQPGYPPRGEAERFVIKWKYTDSGSWISSLSVPADMAKDVCEENDFSYMCYSVTELQVKKNLTFVVAAYNKGIERKSEWSNEAYYVTEYDGGLSPPPPGTAEMKIWHVLLIVFFVSVCLFFILALALYRYKSKRTKYRNVPIFHSTRGESGSGMTNLTSPLTRELSKSIQNIPLPPVPGEHIYEELPNKAEIEYDEDMYLKPKNMHSSKSSDSLDIGEYLKPTYRRPIDTSNLSSASLPTDEKLTPPSKIPIKSYEQKTIIT